MLRPLNREIEKRQHTPSHQRTTPIELQSDRERKREEYRIVLSNSVHPPPSKLPQFQFNLTKESFEVSFPLLSNYEKTEGAERKEELRVSSIYIRRLSSSMVSC